MRRFFHAQGPGPDGTLVLDEIESRHASLVVRLRAGEAATVLDGRGGEFGCTVIEVGRHGVRLRVDTIRQHPEPTMRVRLLQAITKGKSFETILQKAVELGATEIQPLITERVVARPAPAEFPGKVAKWQHIAIEAVKQSGVPWLPVIHSPVALDATLAMTAGCRAVAAIHPDARAVHNVFVRGMAQCASVWVGPEGDFTPEELEQLLTAGVEPVTLGGTVLRSETAALYLLSVFRYEFSRPHGPRVSVQ